MHGASAVFVVKDGNGTACIMADFSAAFLTSYDTQNGSKVGNTRALHALLVCVIIYNKSWLCSCLSWTGDVARKAADPKIRALCPYPEGPQNTVIPLDLDLAV